MSTLKPPLKARVELLRLCDRQMNTLQGAIGSYHPRSDNRHAQAVLRPECGLISLDSTVINAPACDALDIPRRTPISPLSLSAAHPSIATAPHSEEEMVGVIEAKLHAMGLALPEAHPMPNPNRRPCVVAGNILYLSGHGSARIPGPADLRRTGKVEAEVSEQEAYRTARAVALAIMASIKHELGDLDRVKRVIRLYGMINSSPGFERQFAVMDGASDLFFEVWGPEKGQHARAAVGIYELPRRSVIEIMGEFEIE